MFYHVPLRRATGGSGHHLLVNRGAMILSEARDLFLQHGATLSCQSSSTAHEKNCTHHRCKDLSMMVFACAEHAMRENPRNKFTLNMSYGRLATTKSPEEYFVEPAGREPLPRITPQRVITSKQSETKDIQTRVVEFVVGVSFPIFSSHLKLQKALQGRWLRAASSHK